MKLRSGPFAIDLNARWSHPVSVQGLRRRSKNKRMTLSVDEFLRRFQLHVLPKGFVRIRHYGLLASANVKTKLKRCQWLLDCEKFCFESGWRIGSPAALVAAISSQRLHSIEPESRRKFLRTKAKKQKTPGGSPLGDFVIWWGASISRLSTRHRRRPEPYTHGLTKTRLQASRSAPIDSDEQIRASGGAGMPVTAC